jgi:hypothetical protein
LGNPFVGEVRLGFARRFAICFFPAADWRFVRDWDQSGLDVNPWDKDHFHSVLRRRLRASLWSGQFGGVPFSVRENGHEF